MQRREGARARRCSSALEKKDAEELALLRSQSRGRAAQGDAGRQAAAARRGESQSRGSCRSTRTWSRPGSSITCSRPFMNQFEAAHLAHGQREPGPDGLAGGRRRRWRPSCISSRTRSSGSSRRPGPPTAAATSPARIQASGGAAGAAASILNTIGSMSATLGGYQRRQDDLTHQADLATKELQQVEEQIAAAEMRVAIARAGAGEPRPADRKRRRRWTTTCGAQVHQPGALRLDGRPASAVYFQSYQLAYDVAKRAERAFRYELGLARLELHPVRLLGQPQEGPAGGERLHHDLKRMEVAYLDQNSARVRDHQAHLAAARRSRSALIPLKETGECFVYAARGAVRPRLPRPLPAADQVGERDDSLRDRAVCRASTAR